MLVKKEDEREIWTDKLKDGTGMKFVFLAIIFMLLSVFLMILMGCNFSVIETYYLLGIFLFPAFILLFGGLILKNREKEDTKLIAKVNNEYVEMYEKKGTKKIGLNQITKINRVLSNIGNFLVFFYDENGKHVKYTFKCSDENTKLLLLAIQEYNKSIEVNIKRG